MPSCTRTVATAPRPRSSLRFEDGADGFAGWRSLGRLDVGNEADHFEEQIEIEALLRGDFHENRAFATSCPFFGNESAIGELLFHAIGIGFRLIDFVYRNDDRYFRGLGVIDGFEGLRHDAVVCSHHDDDDVCHLGSAGTHARECFVARGVEEDDLAARSRRSFLAEADLVGSDVLGDATGFPCGYVGFTDGVEERSLAVIDVAHDGDDGSTGNLEFVGVGSFKHFFDGLIGQLFFVADDGGSRAELGGDVLHHFGVE